MSIHNRRKGIMRTSFFSRFRRLSAKPAEIGPVLKPGGYLLQISCECFCMFGESGVNSLRQGFALSNGDEQAIFLRSHAAEIDRVIHAMHSEENGLGFELGYGGNALTLAAFAESVAEKFGVVVEFLNFEHQRVYWIVESQELHVGLQHEAQIASGGFGNVARLQRFEGGSVESFDVRPFQSNHIQSDGLFRARPLRIFSEP